MGYIIFGDPRNSDWRETFIDRVVERLLDREYVALRQSNVQQQAITRFGIERILEEWKIKIFD
jgi:hypothetical protein